MTVRTGALVGIIGAPGSGKSALLSAIAGDMFKSDGKLKRNVSPHQICTANYINHLLCY